MQKHSLQKTPRRAVTDDVDNVMVIVRTVGERTAELCERLVRQQVPAEERVVSISEKPFSKAVRKAFKIGVEAGLPWTLCLDADVLLRPFALRDLVDAAEKQPKSTFCVEGHVADKLLGHVRFAGNHLYRTRLLRRGLQNAEITDRVIRPERHVKNQMSAQGHGLYIADPIVGLHDFEQYYVDLFRKALVHGRKFALELEQYALAYWQERAPADPDLRVALWATETSSIFEGPVKVDRRAFPDSLDTLLQMAGMEEKEPLPRDAVGAEDVERMLDAFEETPGYQQWSRFLEIYRTSPLGRARAVLDRYGPAGAAMHLAGKSLLQLGKHFKERAER